MCNIFLDQKLFILECGTWKEYKELDFIFHKSIKQCPDQATDFSKVKWENACEGIQQVKVFSVCLPIISLMPIKWEWFLFETDHNLAISV